MFSDWQPGKLDDALVHEVVVHVLAHVNLKY